MAKSKVSFRSASLAYSSTRRSAKKTSHTVTANNSKNLKSVSTWAMSSLSKRRL